MSKAAALCFCVLLVFAGTAAAQGPPAPARDAQFEIHGKLIFSSPNPPDERIEVMLERNMQRVTSAFTDSLGNFEFRALTPGNYTVVVKLPGYEDISQVIELFNNQRTTNVSIPMNKLYEVVRKEGHGFEGDDPDVVDIKMMSKTYPKKAVQEYEKALDDSKKGDAQKAAGHLEEAIKIAPDFYHALNNLGVVYQRLSRFSDGEAVLHRAIEINPKAQQPHLNLGILYLTEADARHAESFNVVGKLLDQAMDSLDEAIRLKPNSALAHYYLGAAYYKSNFYEEAEASLKKAQFLEPAMGPARLMLINVYVKQRRWKDAIEQIDGFLHDNPKAQERGTLEDMRGKIVKGLASTPSQ